MRARVGSGLACYLATLQLFLSDRRSQLVLRRRLLELWRPVSSFRTYRSYATPPCPAVLHQSPVYQALHLLSPVQFLPCRSESLPCQFQSSPGVSRTNYLSKVQFRFGTFLPVQSSSALCSHLPWSKKPIDQNCAYVQEVVYGPSVNICGNLWRDVAKANCHGTPTSSWNLDRQPPTIKNPLSYSALGSA
ncbi:hypothetical protein SKAU_G00173080 [Synaphobranchus kaupii]|uniref:Uncharacterized protein n=1 Tax=Synaphobranchus kaupii TaxID=118154 RepID=A0A9Q1J0J9_SYNKA|nr:hypothetical protein SKAU_G00173080 [Synaphobranchus kaupii]